MAAISTRNRMQLAQGAFQKVAPEAQLKSLLHRVLKEMDSSGAPRQGRDFIRAVTKGDRDRIFEHYSPVEKAAMNEFSGLQGGYIVPTEYSLALLHSVEENSFIEPRATVIPMTTGQMTCPIVSTKTVQAAGTSPFFGGISFTWGQAPSQTTLGESEPKFDALSLRPCDLIGQLVASNQFVQDMGPEGEMALCKLFGRAAAWYKEYAFLNGTGASNLQPLGVLNAPCAINSTRSSTNNILAADVASMASKLTPFSWNHAIWACSPTTISEVASLDGYVPNEDPLGTEQGCVGSLLTRPVFVTEKLPALGQRGDLIFFDPSLYVIANRSEVMIESSPHPLFTNYQTVYRVWLRCDGKPLLSSSVTLQDGTSTASSIVVLSA